MVCFADPFTEILGGKDVFMDQHSVINLTCVVHSPEQPAHIFWMHGKKVCWHGRSVLKFHSYPDMDSIPGIWFSSHFARTVLPQVNESEQATPPRCSGNQTHFCICRTVAAVVPLAAAARTAPAVLAQPNCSCFLLPIPWRTEMAFSHEGRAPVLIFPSAS